ncbi:MAG: M28 family peptidase [Chitinophagales bacterium]|nr:M28 family peptidase [Chitinophagales bacterium]
MRKPNFTGNLRSLIINFRSLILLICIQLLWCSAGAQSPAIIYAHQVIDILTSKELHGRGYVDSGDYKAARFIRTQMMEAGLQSFQEDYFQPFTLNTTIFPGAIHLTLNRKELMPGKDFLVAASSNSCKGKFECIALRKNILDTTIYAVHELLTKLSIKRPSEKMVMISKDEFTKDQYVVLKKAISETSAFGARGIIEFSENKLTWNASEDQVPFCYLYVKGAFPDKKKTTVKINIESRLNLNYKTHNVVGYVRGKEAPDSFIVFTAHYDHLGEMGDGVYFPGANDNASGISMVLNLARYFSNHPLRYSVVFICFSGEELGLLGSQHYVSNPLFPLEAIKFLINLDIVGTGDEGIKVVNATEFPNEFEAIVKLNDQEQLMKQVSPRGKAANSDHYPFYLKQVPCFFIYTLGGISAYHDIYDRAETLPLTDYDDLLELLIRFTNNF